MVPDILILVFFHVRIGFCCDYMTTFLTALFLLSGTLGVCHGLRPFKQGKCVATRSLERNRMICCELDLDDESDTLARKRAEFAASIPEEIDLSHPRIIHLKNLFGLRYLQDKADLVAGYEFYLAATPCYLPKGMRVSDLDDVEFFNIITQFAIPYDEFMFPEHYKGGSTTH
jgi:hypothetical protein